MSSMNNYYAFAEGALTKLAEHNVAPSNFVNAAVRSRDPEAIKIAEAIIDYSNASRSAGYEKTASVLYKTAAPAMPGMLSRAGSAIGDSFRRVGDMGDELGSAARGQLSRHSMGAGLPDQSDEALYAYMQRLGAGPDGLLSARGRAGQLAQYGADLAPAAGVMGAGAGLAAGAGAGGYAAYDHFGGGGQEVTAAYNPYGRRW